MPFNCVLQEAKEQVTPLLLHACIDYHNGIIFVKVYLCKILTISSYRVKLLFMQAQTGDICHFSGELGG